MYNVTKPLGIDGSKGSGQAETGPSFTDHLPWMEFDPLNPADRKKTGRSLIISPTGAGKSALLVPLIMQMAASDGIDEGVLAQARRTAAASSNIRTF